MFERIGKMKRTILLVGLLALFVLAPAVRAEIVYAADSCRTELYNGTDPKVDENRSDTSKLNVRGDYKAMKSWIKFDISNVDVSSLTSAEFRLTLHKSKSGSCSVSAINDDYTVNIGWTSDDLTWNSAPGNITSSDGENPDDGSYTTDNLQEDLIASASTLIGTLDYSDGSAGDQFTIDVLSILQADSDGIVQFVIHDSTGNTEFSTHTNSGGEEYYPALVLIPEPATMILMGLGGLIVSRRKR